MDRSAHKWIDSPVMRSARASDTGRVRERRTRNWSLYIVRCADGTFYTGVAKDVCARLAQHNSGRGAAYTRSRRPVLLAYRTDGLTHSQALIREARIRRLSRPLKETLVLRARARMN